MLLGLRRLDPPLGHVPPSHVSPAGLRLVVRAPPACVAALALGPAAAPAAPLAVEGPDGFTHVAAAAALELNVMFNRGKSVENLRCLGLHGAPPKSTGFTKRA